MKELWNTFQAVIAALGGWLGYFLGGCDGLLYALIVFVILDYITGGALCDSRPQAFQCSWVQGNLQKGAYLRTCRHCEHTRRSRYRYWLRCENGYDIFLHIQRGCVDIGECGEPRFAGAEKGKGSFETAPRGSRK